MNDLLSSKHDTTNVAVFNIRLKTKNIVKSLFNIKKYVSDEKQFYVITDMYLFA